MLVRVSLNDSQVPYWEGGKFAAKVRALNTDKHYPNDKFVVHFLGGR